MTINDIKPLTSKATYDEMKQNFDILYMYSEYSEEFLMKLPREYFLSPASTKYHGSFKSGLIFHSTNVALFTYRNLIEMKKMEVSKYLNDLNDKDFEQYLKDAVFAGLFHDFCKINVYKNEEDATEKQIEYALGLCKELNLQSDLFDVMNLGKSSLSNFIEKAKQLLYDLNNDKVDENTFIKRADELSLIKREYIFQDDFKIGHGEKSVIMLLRYGVQLTDHQIYAIRFHQNEMDVLWEIEKERQNILIHTDKIPMQKSIILAEKISGWLYEKGKDY